ncbi:MAG: Ig-like domain-containing protein [Candidatus Cloacimonetes bacterium]|nr:Ig-like domain-containing protein [Candidatus Cloacimonadota bacterium]
MNKQLIRLLVLAFIILSLISCGSKDSLTGGPIDTVRPELVSVYPEELQEIGDGKIELVFTKELDKISTERSVYIFPPVENLNVKSSKSTVNISFKSDLQPDTNYFLTLSKSLKDIHNNTLEKNKTLIFKHGKLNTYKVRGVVTYEKDEFKGHPVNLSVLTTDSLLVLTSIIENDRFEIPNLNPGDYLLRAYSDVNENFRYDFGKDLFFEGIFSQKKTSIRLELALADSTLPKLRSGRFQYKTYLNLNISEEIKKFDTITITANNDSLTIPYSYAVIDENYLNLITGAVDTLTYKVTVTGMEDLKGNIRKATAINVKGITKQDTLPPTIIKTWPEDGRTIKTLNPEIQITFSEIIPKKQLVCSLTEIESGKEIKLSTLLGDSSKAMLMPIQKLKPYYSYRFVISAATADAAYNFMEKDYEITFLPVAME